MAVGRQQTLAEAPADRWFGRRTGRRRVAGARQCHDLSVVSRIADLIQFKLGNAAVLASRSPTREQVGQTWK